MTAPRIEILDASNFGCDMAGATSRTGAAYICVFMRRDVSGTNIPVFSSEGSGAFTLVRSSSGPLYIWLSGSSTSLTGYTYSFATSLVTQVGFLFWQSGSTKYFQPVVNGVPDPIVLSTTATINPVVSVLGYDPTVDPNPPAVPVYFDDMLFWAAGNSLTDADLLNIYRSYLDSEAFDDEQFEAGLFTTGWETSAFAAGRFSRPTPGAESCISFSAPCVHLEFAAVAPCLEFSSRLADTEFSSAKQLAFTSPCRCAS